MIRHLDVMLADCRRAPVRRRRTSFTSGGFLDVVQCDILHAGVTGWLWLRKRSTASAFASARMVSGFYLGNYVTGRLAGAVKGLSYIEWDEAAIPGLTAAGLPSSVKGVFSCQTSPVWDRAWD